MKKTINALLSRSIDSRMAESLATDGHTLGSLQQMTAKELRKLGLSPNQIEAIHKDRPPIPQDTLYSILYECRRTCCICRDSTKPIVVHHIEPWAESRSHAPSNLVVLCLEHHDLAHTTKELSQSMSAKEIVATKEKWLEQTKVMDAKTILGLAKQQGARWDYFNYDRFFELMMDVKPGFKDLSCYYDLRALGLLNDKGILAPESSWSSIINENRCFRTSTEKTMEFNVYMKQLADRVFSKVPIVDITNRRTPTELRSILNSGTFFYLQAGFRHREIKPEQKNGSHIREAYYKKKGLRISFVYDAWNCTSSSARYHALTGHELANPICVVRSIQTKGGELQIVGSCYAIGINFDTP